MAKIDVQKRDFQSLPQIGGDHYTTDGCAQPIDLIDEAQLTFPAGNILKYMFRFPRKGGAFDVGKALDRLDHIEKVRPILSRHRMSQWKRDTFGNKMLESFQYGWADLPLHVNPSQFVQCFIRIIRSPHMKNHWQQLRDAMQEIYDLCTDQPRKVWSHWDTPEGVMNLDQLVQLGQLNYWQGNILKYMLRFPTGKGAKDIAKSTWYVQDLLARRAPTIQITSKDKKIFLDELRKTLNYMWRDTPYDQEGFIKKFVPIVSNTTDNKLLIPLRKFNQKIHAQFVKENK